jgi:hypothetical protein
LDVGATFGIEEYGLFHASPEALKMKFREILIFGPRVSRVPKFPAEILILDF